MRVKDTRTTIIAIEGSDVISDFGVAFSQVRRAREVTVAESKTAD
jgi:hypothetical protein